jgi:hypothetical protein
MLKKGGVGGRVASLLHKEKHILLIYLFAKKLILSRPDMYNMQPAEAFILAQKPRIFKLLSFSLL